MSSNFLFLTAYSSWNLSQTTTVASPKKSPLGQSLGQKVSIRATTTVDLCHFCSWLVLDSANAKGFIVSSVLEALLVWCSPGQEPLLFLATSINNISHYCWLISAMIAFSGNQKNPSTLCHFGTFRPVTCFCHGSPIQNPSLPLGGDEETTKLGLPWCRVTSGAAVLGIDS